MITVLDIRVCDSPVVCAFHILSHKRKQLCLLYCRSVFFADETMQILRQAANQLLTTPSSSRMSNIQMMKRAIPDFPNLQDVVQMLENIQRRLLD